jgi:hypothetical protein
VVVPRWNVATCNAVIWKFNTTGDQTNKCSVMTRITTRPTEMNRSIKIRSVLFDFGFKSARFCFLCSESSPSIPQLFSQSSYHFTVSMSLVTRWPTEQIQSPLQSPGPKTTPDPRRRTWSPRGTRRRMPRHRLIGRVRDVLFHFLEKVSESFKNVFGRVEKKEKKNLHFPRIYALEHTGTWSEHDFDTS